jgi:hypothetical protein
MWKKHTPLWHVVARSTCRSQNGKNTTCSDKPLEVEMFKKATALWREARFQVKTLKAPQLWNAFGR